LQASLFPWLWLKNASVLEDDISAATSTSHKKKLEKEREKLVKQQAELLSFDEKLRHYADRRISLNLDDGVKVNYGKFGDLLAEVKAVTGEKKE
jgi:transcription antitermination factor NusG